MSNRAQLILVVILIAGGLGFVAFQVFRDPGVQQGKAARSYAPGATFTERSRLQEFVNLGVRVTLCMDDDLNGQPLLRALFSPTDRGFHVYSKDLDPNRTGGVGLATQLELLPNPAVKTVGQLFADVTPEHREGVDVYPEGPVQLRLPIQFVQGRTNVPAQVAVSYMACNSNICLRPVKRKIVDVQLVSP